METRNVGRSGLRVSAVGMGCNNFGWMLDEADSIKVIHGALDRGITLFDTAPVYGTKGGESETILGKGLGNRRKDAVILTKFGIPIPIGPEGMKTDTSRTEIMASIDASLKRLGTDYVDIFMLHWPDDSTPMEETLRALDDVVRSGKARYIAISNQPAWRVVEARWISKTEHLNHFILSENEYSLAQRDADTGLIPALSEYGLALMPYSPLANGLLTGKFGTGKTAPADSRLGRNQWGLGDRLLTPGTLEFVDKLTRFAEERDHTLLELAFGWLLSKDIVCSVIAGATKIEQVEANTASAGWRLTAEEMSEVDRICAERKA